MATHIHRKVESEDQETVFNSYSCAYYVQSPSTISHANSSDLNKPHNLELSTLINSPSRSDTILLNKNPELSRFTLSHYSSSRGSNNSLFNDKKIIHGDQTGINRLIIVDGFDDDDDDDDDDDNYYGRNGGFWRTYCSFRRSSSCAWVSLQLFWRFVVSLGIALLVFYIATKPPPPHFSIKVGEINEFGLGEGVDGTGVTTKILNCNFSMDLLIENNSKLFGLHIQPPLLEMFFARLPFAISRGSKLYAESHSSTRFKLHVGTKNKAMYGAGRNMEDMLESGNGLPILIRIRLSSHFRVISHFIKPKYRHQAQCLLFLDSKYHQTHAYNTTCTMSS